MNNGFAISNTSLRWSANDTVSLKLAQYDHTFTYWISLTSRPSADVTVTPYVYARDGTAPITVTPASGTLSPDRWWDNLLFTVTAPSEPGRHIILHYPTSDDPDYRYYHSHTYGKPGWFFAAGAHANHDLRVTVEGPEIIDSPGGYGLSCEPVPNPYTYELEVPPGCPDMLQPQLITPNRPPSVSASPANLNGLEAGSSRTIALSGVFHDPDGVCIQLLGKLPKLELSTMTSGYDSLVC